MASPFSIFRSNLKPLMVALTLLALFAFVVLPAIQMYQQNNLPGATDLTVATFDGGKFESDEIAYYQRLHGQTNRFLAEVAERVVAAGGSPRVPNYGMNSNRQMSFGITPYSSPEMAVMAKLYAQKASDLGMELDDTALRTWLDQFTDGKLSSNELAAIRAQTSQNTLGEAQMYGLLRTELLANLYDRMMTSGLTTGRDLLNSPLVTWNNFLKINQQAKATAYPVLVEEFIDQAGAPSKATLEKLYEEGKDRNPDPTSPEPGFRKPYAANVEYVAAHLEDFIGREIDKLTEEQLRTEYKRRVESGDFVEPEMDFTNPLGNATGGVIAPPATTEEPAGDDQPAPAGDAPAEDAKPAEPAVDAPAATEPTGGEPAAEETPATEEVPPETPAPSEGNGSPENSESTGSGEPAAEGSTTEDPKTDEPAGEEPNNGGSGDQPLSLNVDNAVSLVAAVARQEDGPQEDGPQESGSQPPAEDPVVTEEPANTEEPAVTQDPPATEEPAAETPAPAQEPAAEQPAGTDQPPVTEQPATTEQPPVTDPAATSDPAKPAEGAPAEGAPAETAPAQDATTDGDADPQPPAEEKPAGPKPFEEMKDQIARELALPKARQAYQDSINEAYDTMKNYFTDVAVWESDKQGDKPLPPDLKQLANELGLRYETTGMTTFLDVYETPLGRSRVGTGGTGDFFVTTMYNDSRPVYSAVRAENRMAEGGEVAYSAWKTEAREAYIPKLEEVRDEVVAAAKLQAARELAQAKAKELAEQANASPETSLTELVPETRKTLVFEELGPFPWMISLGFQYNPIMANVSELDNVGNEFMKAVFTGPVGEYEVAPNVPKSVYYVVKATEITPAAEELRTRFMQANQRAMAEPLSIDDIRTIRQSSAERFEESIGLEFNQEALSGR